MTNKRKKLIRAVAERTGVSHAGAANILNNKSRLTISPTVLTLNDIDQLFVIDSWSETGDGGRTVGPFRHAGNTWPCYEKSPEDHAYVVGDEGENLMMIKAPKHVFVPLALYQTPEGDHTHIRQALLDRMAAMLGAVAQEYCPEHDSCPRVRQADLNEHFLNEFQGQSGVIHLVRGVGRSIIIYKDAEQAEARSPKDEGIHERNQTVFAVLGHAGIRVNGPVEVTQHMRQERVGLVAYASRIRAAVAVSYDPPSIR